MNDLMGEQRAPTSETTKSPALGPSNSDRDGRSGGYGRIRHDCCL